MATFKFYLHQPKLSKIDKDGNKIKGADGKVIRIENPNETGIYLYISESSKQVPFKSKERIKPKYWDFQEKQIKSRYTGFEAQKSRLKEFKNKIKGKYDEITEKYPETPFDIIIENLKEFDKSGVCP
ncbi:MAG TPA: hypothetical protein DDX98_01690, partial [Bacteroidales bacterium]|nr:hypothetical protein [Bacteroidales bacterium]